MAQDPLHSVLKPRLSKITNFLTTSVEFDRPASVLISLTEAGVKDLVRRRALIVWDSTTRLFYNI